MGLLSKLYSSVVNSKNRGFDEGRSEIIDCGVPVISIGNLSVGGTGKTPLTALIAGELIKMNKKIAIVGRGYNRLSKGEVIVSDGVNILAGPEEAGDEMLLLAQKLMVPVIAHDNKTKGAISAVEQFNPECILVDDGYQHRRLKRELDVLIIDEETLVTKTLPEGRLREPLNEIKRADVVCLNGISKLTGELLKFLKTDAVVLNIKGKAGKPYDLISRNELNESRLKSLQIGVAVVSGIAKPHRFYKLLDTMNVNISGKFCFTDHHHYKSKDLEKVIYYCKNTGLNEIATTEKDAVKLKVFSDLFSDNELNCNVFPINLFITKGNEMFGKKLNALFDRT